MVRQSTTRGRSRKVKSLRFRAKLFQSRAPPRRRIVSASPSEAHVYALYEYTPLDLDPDEAGMIKEVTETATDVRILTQNRREPLEISASLITHRSYFEE